MCYLLNCNFILLSYFSSHLLNSGCWVFFLLFDSQPQAQVQDEEITEDDLRLIEERESSIRQLEVSTSGFTAECAFHVSKEKTFYSGTNISCRH